MIKSLDQKLASIHADPAGAKDFILADAKDADMAFGVGAPGRSPELHAGEVRFRTLAEFREQIRQIVQQQAVDIMLMSASTNDLLSNQERLFDASPVTPAARANDASDIFALRGSRYAAEPSRPFRTATIDHIQCGHLDCTDQERTAGTNLGLYSVTFANRLDEDLRTLEEYHRFRLEAERAGFRHFLEVFDPNVPAGMPSDVLPAYINDCIARTLAGVTGAGRPLFLKVVYHGPRAMEELISYDPHLIVGILGGGAGTTYDAFKLLSEARKYGARVALFGRKINNAECQLAFVRFLRLIADGQIEPEEAVRAYHGALARLKIKPHRSLADDLALQTAVMSYTGSSTVTAPGSLAAQRHELDGAAPAKQVPATNVSPPRSQDCGCGGGHPQACTCGTKADGSENQPAASSAQPDFKRMTQAEKTAYQQAKRDRIFG